MSLRSIAARRARRRRLVAEVRAADGVRFVAVAPTRGALVARLARYVADRAADYLWPTDADAVRELLGRGDAAGAVRRYFATVGARWDDEWLRVGGLARARLGIGAAGAALAGF